MAGVWSVVWLISLMSPFMDSLTLRNDRDLQLLFRYRKLVDEHVSNKSCTGDYNYSGNKPLVLDYEAWEGEMRVVNNVANFLTSVWRYKDSQNFSVVENREAIYSLVKSNTMSSKYIHGSVVCFDRDRFRNLTGFCPHAFKDKSAKNRTRIVDFTKYDYLNKTGGRFTWWKVGRSKALKHKPGTHFIYFDNTISKQIENASVYINVTSTYVPRSAGTWTTPYYNCFAGRTWVLTYLVPFYDEDDQVLGLVGFDVELDSIEIDECDMPRKPRIQASTDHYRGIRVFTLYGNHACKNQSTKCVHVPGRGFREGSYHCVCRKGYYFPNTNIKPEEQYFEGKKVLEVRRRSASLYKSMFDCLPCPDGCDECVDDTPCMYSRKMVLRMIILSMNEVIKALAIALGLFIFIFRERKIIKASSPVFMEIIALGIVLMYFEISLGYAEASIGVCIAKSWLYHTGFILAFGSLLLKTWRIAVIFRLRSAKMIELTDMTLLKYLALMVTAVLMYLMIWTWTNTQAIEIKTISTGLKYRRCVREWFSNAMEIGEILFLGWGVWLCLRVRNAPSAYNESKYIAWCIYNTVFIMILVGLLRYLLDDFDNPDVSYIVDFLSTHVVATILLVLLFVSKIFLLRKYTKEVTKNLHGSSVPSTTATDVRKSPFRLNRLVDGTLVHEIDEETNVKHLEMENILLREEIRGLNAQLALLENKQARLSRHRTSVTDEEPKTPCSLHKVHPHGRKEGRTANSELPRAENEKREGKTSTLGSTSSSSSMFSREEKGGSLLDDIKNAGKTDYYLAMPGLKNSVSDETLTVISRLSADERD